MTLLSTLDSHMDNAKSLKEQNFKSPEKTVVNIDIMKESPERRTKSFTLSSANKSKEQNKNAQSSSKEPLHCLMLPEDNPELFKFVKDVSISMGSKDLEPEVLANNQIE